MQGLWKNKVSGYYYKNGGLTKRKKQKIKHFIKDKKKILRKNYFNNTFFINKNILKESIISIDIPVFKVKVIFKEKVDFDFNKCKSCREFSLNNDLGYCNLVNYKEDRNVLNDIGYNHRTTMIFNECLIYGNVFFNIKYKNVNIYLDIVSQDKGFRDYYTKELIIPIENLFKGNIYSSLNGYDKWVLDYKIGKYNNIELPIPIGKQLHNIYVTQTIKYKDIESNRLSIRDKYPITKESDNRLLIDILRHNKKNKRYKRKDKNISKLISEEIMQEDIDYRMDSIKINTVTNKNKQSNNTMFLLERFIKKELDINECFFIETRKDIVCVSPSMDLLFKEISIDILSQDKEFLTLSQTEFILKDNGKDFIVSYHIKKVRSI